MLAVGAGNQADFAGLVEALQDGVDDREVARVNRQIDADREQALAHFHRRHRDAAAQCEPDGVRESHRHRGRQANQLRQRADGLGELRQPFVDLAALLAERFVFLDRGGQGGSVVFRRHDTILYIMYNHVSTGGGHRPYVRPFLALKGVRQLDEELPIQLFEPVRRRTVRDRRRSRRT